MTLESPPPALSLHRVGVTFGDGPTAVEALREVTLDVQPGELVAVTGRSGTGKSTLLNVAGGLVAATSGRVWVCGQAMTGSSPRGQAALRRRHVGYVFQDLNLLPTLRAVENVSLPLELAGQDRADAEAAAHEALARVGLGPMATRFPDELSGGQRQRVAIARGLVGRRSLLLVDEPTSALDEVTGEEILGLIREQCNQGSAALMVTHQPSLAAWADRVVRLSGRPGPDSIESESVRPARRIDLSELVGPADPGR